MASWRDTFLSLPLDARRRYAELNCGRGIKPRIGGFPPIPSPPPRHSKQECLDFAIQHQVVSKDELYTAIHKYKSENPPSMEQIEYLFGSFLKFRQELEDDPRCWEWSRPISDEDLARYCAQLGIRSSEDYRQLLKTPRGEGLPSISKIIDRFGSWALFIMVVMSYDIDVHLEAYFQESMKAGHPLSVKECDALGIEIRHLRKMMSPDLLQVALHERESIYRLEAGHDGVSKRQVFKTSKKEDSHEECTSGKK